MKMLIINRKIMEKGLMKNSRMSWFSCQFVNVIYYRLSEALILAKGALWRDEISCMLAKHSKFEEFLQIHTRYINLICDLNILICRLERTHTYYLLHRFKNNASDFPLST